MTPDDDRTHLTRALLAKQTHLSRMGALFAGTLPSGFTDPDFWRLSQRGPQTFDSGLGCLLATETVSRLVPLSFATSPEDRADEDMTAMYRALRMPEIVPLILLDAIVYGSGFAAVSVDSAGKVVVTAESPLNTIVRRDQYGNTVSALKRWRDPADGTTYSTLMRPDATRLYASKSVGPVDPLQTTQPPFLAEDAELVAELPNPDGIVPLVDVVNRPTTINRDGESDLASLEDIVRAADKMYADMMVSAEAQAIRQRYVATPSVLTEEQAREIKEAMIKSLAAPGGNKVSVLGGGATLNELSAAELTNFRVGVELLADQFASTAGLPGYYVRASQANPTSADAIRAAEYRFTAKIRQRQAWFGPAIARVMRLAQKVRDGYADPRLDQLETIWQDAEPRTVAQEADAQAKLYAAGIIDRRAALQALDLPPLEIERILSESDGAPLPDQIQTVTRDANGDLTSVRTYTPRPNVA